MTEKLSLEFLDDVLAAARKAGADAADALLVDSTSLSVARRLGQPEALERSESCDLGLRVFVGKKQALVSTADFTPAMLNELSARAVAMARAVPEDPYCGIADPEDVAQDWPDLDLCDPQEKTAAELEDLAQKTEAAALDVKGITNSEGAEASWGQSRIFFAASNGFSGMQKSSHYGISVAVIAGEGESMERDYDWTAAVYEEDLELPETVGARAADRTLKRLNPRKAKTKKVPVVYDPRVSGGLIRTLAGGISGSAVARGTTFLKDLMGEQVFPEDITVIDDPLMKRGHRSRPFDGEGLKGQKRALIDKGILTSWILDLRSARQLGLQSTGHASRGTGSPPSPSPSNLYLQPGAKTPEDLIGEIEDGFYITEMMGSSVSLITGDYSRGATGFWIEKGRIAYPVSEVTVAGNLKDMWLRLEAANDLVHRTGVDAPTLRIDGMTVAGV